MLEEILESLYKLSYQERLNLLNDKDLVDTLFLLKEKQSPWNFEKVLELYEASDLLKLLDKERIEKIKKLYSNMEFLFLEFLKDKGGSDFEESIKNNIDLKELLLLKGQNMAFKLNFSLDTLIDLINYATINNFDYHKTCLFYIMDCSLKDKDTHEKFLNSKVPDFYKIRMFNFLDKDIVTKYIKEHNIIFSSQDLYNLLIYSTIEINPNLYYNKKFFKEVIIKKTIYETRVELEHLSNMIDTTYFEELLKKEEEKLINAYLFHTKVNSLFDYDINQQVILDMIIDYMFQDSSHNVYLNVVELVEFCLKNQDLITKDKLTFYKELLNIYKSPENYLINFWNKYKESFKASDFYDDMSLAKNKSYEMIKSACLKISDIKDLKDQNLSNKYGVDIYELMGDEFSMLVSCRRQVPDLTTVSKRNCYTLIGSWNMQVIYDDTYIFGFNEFDIKNILHVYEDDAYSNDNKSRYTTSYVNRIRTPDEIIKNKYRSEIQIINKEIKDDCYLSLMPSYVVSFDIITQKDIDAAFKLNVPIIIINRQKYKAIEYSKDLPNYEEEYTLMPYISSSAREKRGKRGIS